MMKHLPYPMLLGALFSAIILAACGIAPDPSADNAPVPSDTTPVAITVWHAQTGNAPNLLSTLAADFQKTYPWITVNIDLKKSEGDLLKFGIAAMAVNLPPDLLIAQPRTLAEFARRGVLVPLNPLLAQEKIGFTDAERTDFLPGLLDASPAAETPNLLYAFPFDEHAIVMYYNPELLQAARISTPPRTWDEFSAAARATTRGETRGWAMAPLPIVYGAMLASRGTTILDETQTKIQFNDNAGQATIQFIAGLARGGAAYVTNQAQDDFVQGKAALYFGVSDDLVALSDAMARANKSTAWGIALIPQNDPLHPATAVAGNAIGLFRTTAARTRAGWLFTRWLAAPEQTARWSRGTLALPVRASALGILAKEAATHPLTPLFRSGFNDTIPAVRPMPTVNTAAQIDAALVELWTAVGNGADPNAALNRTVTRVQRVLGEGVR